MVETSPQRSQQCMQLQQAMVAKIKSQRYEEALLIADQILKSKPDNPMVQELRRTLAEKLSLDEVDDQGGDDSSSDSDADSDQEPESDSQEDDSDEAPSESGSDADDDIGSAPSVPVCDVLHVNPDHQAVSVQQRKHLRSMLKEQLEDLKIQQAAQSMHILGI